MASMGVDVIFFYIHYYDQKIFFKCFSSNYNYLSFRLKESETKNIYRSLSQAGTYLRNNFKFSLIQNKKLA